MSSGAYLIDHPNLACPQYGWPRRAGGQLSGVVVIHTTESVPDWVGPDTGAENVASWLTQRTDFGSYHVLTDADSTVVLAPWEYETWHDIATNTHSVGISIATQAHRWAEAPPAWRDAALRRTAEAAADFARHVKSARGIDVPARWLSQDEAHRGVPGFVRHGTSDPANRSDPWPATAPEATTFLDYYRAAMAGEDLTMSMTTDQNNALAATWKNVNHLVAIIEGWQKSGAITKDQNAALADVWKKTNRHAQILEALDVNVNGAQGLVRLLDAETGAAVELDAEQLAALGASVAEAIPDSLAQSVVDALAARLAQ